jgi:hypothetical protein
MKVLAYILVLVGLLNLVSFMVLTIAHRGVANPGKIEGGSYYVEDHGRYTEVSPLMFRVSRWQSSAILITQPLMFVGAAYLWYRQRKEPHAA